LDAVVAWNYNKAAENSVDLTSSKEHKILWWSVHAGG